MLLLLLFVALIGDGIIDDAVIAVAVVLGVVGHGPRLGHAYGLG